MRTIKATTPSNFNLFLMGDPHIGARAFYRRGFQQAIDTVLSPYDGLKPHCNKVAFMGDAIEAIMSDDIRYDPKSIDKEQSKPLNQADGVVKLFKPIRKKIVTWLTGNHERKLHRFGNLCKKMAKELKVPYGGFNSRVTFVDKKGDLIFKAYLTHGRMGLGSRIDDPVDRENSMRRSLRRQLQAKAGDCALMAKGHVHKCVIYKPEKELFIMGDDDGLRDAHTEFDHTSFPIPPYHRWYCTTGSFLRLFGEDYDTYGELAEYDPIFLGFPVVKIRDRKIVDIVKIPLE